MIQTWLNMDIEKLPGRISFRENGCMICFKTKAIENDSETWDISSFECSEGRGGGRGKQLLIKSLKYLKEQHDNQPTTLRLFPVPQQLNNMKAYPSDKANLEKYYRTLGFINSSKNEAMIGNFNSIMNGTMTQPEESQESYEQEYEYSTDGNGDLTQDDEPNTSSSGGGRSSRKKRRKKRKRLNKSKKRVSSKKRARRTTQKKKRRDTKSLF